MAASRPNIVYVFADQWRAQALGYAGNETVQTPNIDRLAATSLNLTHAVAGCSVCCPARATLLTGQYADTHGVFMNDVPLNPEAQTLGKLFKGAGYKTAYIGKWHVDGHGRSRYIPPQRQQGFDYWRVLECTHSYNESYYFADDSDERLTWEGYDAIAQTADAQRYLRQQTADQPFTLMLAWGPPHAPYETAPDTYRDRYSAADMPLRPNVPASAAEEARNWLAGYYAHCSALDDCVGAIWETLVETGLAENTIFVFTSDHGDMLGSHGWEKKQKPWDESIRVPFLIHYPRAWGLSGRELTVPIDTPDILPTLLGLCDLPIPASVQGINYAGYLLGEQPLSDVAGADGAALLACYQPFGQWPRAAGGREYRGLRTERYTYVRSLDAPWLLYDNRVDPYQMTNLIDHPEFEPLQQELEAQLQSKLDRIGDRFLHGLEYVRLWGYPLDETETVPFEW